MSGAGRTIVSLVVAGAGIGLAFALVDRMFGRRTVQVIDRNAPPAAAAAPMQNDPFHHAPSQSSYNSVPCAGERNSLQQCLSHRNNDLSQCEKYNMLLQRCQDSTNSREAVKDWR